MNQWLLCFQPRPKAAVRVFCFPFAGGGASAFRGWSGAFGPDVEVVCIQTPGRESRIRETPVAQLRDLADGVAAAMEPMLDRPYAMFGHSLGGVLAFETTRELRARGALPPLHLFVSASRAPHLPWPHPPLRDLDTLTLLREVNDRYGGSVPPQLMASAELRDLFAPSLRADLAALETYSFEPGPPLACPISAFAGKFDAMVPPAAVDAWRRQTCVAFRMHLVHAGHLFLQTAQTELTDAVRRELTAQGDALASLTTGQRS